MCEQAHSIHCAELIVLVLFWSCIVCSSRVKEALFFSALKIKLLSKPEGAPTEIDRGKSCQARHGVCRLQLSPVSQEDVENVVLRSGSQGALVHAATHQLTVVDHHDWKCDGRIDVIMSENRSVTQVN